MKDEERSVLTVTLSNGKFMFCDDFGYTDDDIEIAFGIGDKYNAFGITVDDEEAEKLLNALTDVLAKRKSQTV